MALGTPSPTLSTDEIRKETGEVIRTWGLIKSLYKLLSLNLAIIGALPHFIAQGTM